MPSDRDHDDDPRRSPDARVRRAAALEGYVPPPPTRPNPVVTKKAAEERMLRGRAVIVTILCAVAAVPFVRPLVTGVAKLGDDARVGDDIMLVFLAAAMAMALARRAILSGLVLVLAVGAAWAASGTYALYLERQPVAWVTPVLLVAIGNLALGQRPARVFSWLVAAAAAGWVIWRVWQSAAAGL